MWSSENGTELHAHRVIRCSVSDDLSLASGLWPDAFLLGDELYGYKYVWISKHHYKMYGISEW